MAFRIPLFDLNFDDAEIQAVVATLKSRWISMGPQVEAFEKAFCATCGGRYAVAVANGTAALHLALLAQGIRAGDEVIVPSLTFVATVNAIRYVGAIPVFCDIKGPADLTLDAEQLPPLITSKTRAVMLMHYGGFPCDMDKIMAVAREHKLFVFEDACHAPLSEYHGQKLGSIGNVGCFSFFSNKTISTGEGGMVVTNDESVYQKAKLLRSHGMTSLSYDRSRGHGTTYDVVELGYNYRMNDIHASIGLAQLAKVKADAAARKLVRAAYLEQLRDCEAITIPFQHHTEMASNYIFPIVLNNLNAAQRDGVRQQLTEAGIQTSMHYPAAHRFTIYKTADAQLPRTSAASDSEITLPMYQRLKTDDVSFICETLKKAVARRPA